VYSVTHPPVTSKYHLWVSGKRPNPKCKWKSWSIVHGTPCCGLEWTRSLWMMDSKWSGNNFLLGSSSLANHGGLD
jgi:hypothetical protein